MCTMLAGFAQFERDLISQRVKSGLAAAKANGKNLGRQQHQLAILRAHEACGRRSALQRGPEVALEFRVLLS
jgi:DNA invertase Pin-like site-specific DNA recombinase